MDQRVIQQNFMAPKGNKNYTTANDIVTLALETAYSGTTPPIKLHFLHASHTYQENEFKT